MDQRKSFRFQENEQKEVYVLLQESREINRRGRLLDMGPEQAMIEFPAPELANVAMGQEVPLTFLGNRIETPIQVSVIAQSRRDTKQARRYGFWFVSPVDVEQKLFPVLRNIFNRRAEFRVTADPNAPVTIEAKHPKTGSAFPGKLDDLSASGMGLQLEISAEAQIADVDHLLLSFQLPKIKDPFQLGAIIRYRELIGQFVRYGLEFDPRRSKNYLAQQKLISQYAMERQRAMVRELKQ